ncbi:ATP phosphoribosyltransferase [Nigerium massiliense]|uniref:ATP phosphoribosyltransferase n=1 Tax=Nigerium massiliense TaxID=1522317 RepID=UPI00058D5196|nr:ATP phosphoribosyltransferase [Nigerium massiliense]
MTPEPALLKIALPNKGSLAESTSSMLREAGYKQRTDTKDLVLVDETNGVEFYYLRPRDIAVYVGERTLDLGVTGRDLLLDSGAKATEIMPLGFGGTKFRFAAPGGSDWKLDDLEGCRLATSFPGLLERFLVQRGITARLIHLDGAVESAVRLGVADAIADVVETGSTLRRAGLDVFGPPILESEAILIQPAGAPEPPGLARLQRRISGVMTARSYRMIAYNVESAKLDAACRITPGIDSPTISPLARDGWLAVQAMIPAKDAAVIMDDLWEVGAEGILVTDIAACRLS